MKNKYDLLRQRIKQVFITLDPPGLIKGGAPDDEYDNEIDLLISHLRECADKEKTIDTIFDIFSASLEESAGIRENYKDVAIEIYRIKKEILG